MTSKAFCLKILAMTGWGRLIEEARDAAGWSQAELAERAGLSPSMVSRFETERVAIRPDAFNRLTQALRALSPADLLIAMGYEVGYPAEDRLPRRLVGALRRLTPAEQDALTVLLERGEGAAKPKGGKVP